MKTTARRTTAAALLVLALAVTGCSSDDDEGADDTSDTTAASTDDSSAPDDTTGSDDTAASDDTDSSDGTGSGNPCEVITQEQWEVLFGAGVTKSEASGGADNCNVLTSGSSPGHEVSLTNLSASFETDFDTEVTNNAGCGDAATELEGIGDQAVIDSTCLGVSGRAWVIVDDGGDVVLISFDAAEPSDADPAEVEETLTAIAQDMIAAR